MNTLLMNAGFTMLIPLISVHFTRDFGMTAVAVGGVLAVRQFTQQGLMMIGGALGDRWGHKPIICAGFFVRAVGFLIFGVATDLATMMLAAVVTALGGTLFEATSKASLATLVEPARRPTIFSIAGLCGGVGLAVGPLVGVALLETDFFWVGVFSAGCFFLGSILGLLFLPNVGGSEGGSSRQSIVETIAVVFRDRTFVLFTATQMGYWFLVNQIYISVPIQVTRVTGDAGLVGVLFTLQAAVAIILQVPLVRFVSKRMRARHALSLGLVVMGLSLGAMALGRDAGTLIACSAVFAVGRILIDPIRDTLTAEMARPEMSAAYFGFGFLALAFGGSAGNVLGGWMMDLSVEPSLAWLPWLTFAVIGCLASAFLMMLRLTTDRSIVQQSANRRLDSLPD